MKINNNKWLFSHILPNIVNRKHMNYTTIQVAIKCYLFTHFLAAATEAPIQDLQLL